MVTLVTDFVIKALNIVLLLHYKIWLWISVFFRGFVLASRRIGTGGVPRRPQQAREHLWGALRYVLERLPRNCHCILLKKALLACLFVCLFNKSVYLFINHLPLHYICHSAAFQRSGIYKMFNHFGSFWFLFSEQMRVWAKIISITAEY